jgi:hypothetical protein
VERRHRRFRSCETIACRDCGALIPVERIRVRRHRALVDPICPSCGLDSDRGADGSLAWMFTLYATDEMRPRAGRWVHRRRR